MRPDTPAERLRDDTKLLRVSSRTAWGMAEATSVSRRSEGSTSQYSHKPEATSEGRLTAWAKPLSVRGAFAAASEAWAEASAAGVPTAEDMTQKETKRGTTPRSERTRG